MEGKLEDDMLWWKLKEEKYLSVLSQHAQLEHQGLVSNIDVEILTHRPDTTLRLRRPIHIVVDVLASVENMNGITTAPLHHTV